MASVAEQNLVAWRGSLSILGGLLVDLESHSAAVLARAGGLTGGSADAWAKADAGVTQAWATYQAVTNLLDQATVDPDSLPSLLASTVVDGPSGRTDPTTAMRAAKAAAEDATAVAGRFAHAWDELGRRALAARTSAAASRDTATVRAADAVAELLAHDPLAVADADLATLEAAADASANRRSAASTAVARLDLDLVDARAVLDDLDADLQAAAPEIERALSRVVGMVRPAPVQDLDALAAWLDRIAAAAPTDATHAAAALDDWTRAADARRAELDAAMAPIRRAMVRRDDGRGLWSALRAKAGARHLDEDATVSQALTDAQDLLWRAPCDLDAAEAALARLAAVLESTEGSPR
jgi:hypothetical protein